MSFCPVHIPTNLLSAVIYSSVFYVYIFFRCLLQLYFAQSCHLLCSIHNVVMMVIYSMSISIFNDKQYVVISHFYTLHTLVSYIISHIHILGSDFDDSRHCHLSWFYSQPVAQAPHMGCSVVQWHISPLCH